MKKAVVVSLLSQKLTVRTDADEADVSEVAEYVGRKIQEVMKQARSASTLTVTLLACLNIADELFRHKRGELVASSRVEKKVRDLVELLDNHIAL